MSNYTDFVNNYMKNKLNEEESIQKADATEKTNTISVKKLQQYINADDVEKFKKEFANLFNNTPKELGSLFQVFDIEGKGTKAKIILQSKQKTNRIEIPVLNKNFAQTKIGDYMPDFIDSLFGKTPFSDDFVNELKLNTDNKKLFIEGCGKGVVPEEFRKKLKAIADVRSDITFDKRKNEWENMGECLTYCSVAMLSHFADKDTKVSTQDFQRAMKAAFKGEKTSEYLDKIKDVDQAMSIDAGLGVIHEVYSRRDKKEEVNDSVKNIVKNILLEVTEKSELCSEAAYSQLIEDGDIPELMAYVKFMSTDNRYKELFAKYKNQLETAFNEGKDKIMELESHDTVEKHVDPTEQEKPQNRVGRLGHHGPMTYIKNHKNLEKVVNDIDGQKWNIFNCAAKLLIKMMKAFEMGSKALDSMKEDLSEGFKQLKDSLKTMKIEDMENEVDKIMESDASPEDKAEQLLMIMSVAIRKYENNVLEDANNTYDENWLTVDEENEGTYKVNVEFVKTLNNNVELVAKTENLYNKVQEALKQLDSESKSAPKEEPKEEQPQEGQAEAPAENASFKPNYTGKIISEGDNDAQASMEKDVKAAADKSAKEAAPKQGEEVKDGQNKDQKKEEPKKEAAKDDTPWQQKKYAFDSIATEIKFGKIGKAAADNPKLIEVYKAIAQKIGSDAETYLNGLAEFLDFCNENKKLEDGRFMNEQEATITIITGQKFMDSCGTIFEKIQTLKDFTNRMASISELTIEPEKVQQLTQEITQEVEQNGLTEDDLKDLQGAGSAVLALSYGGNTDNQSTSGDMVPAAGEIQQQVSGINTDITKANKDNYRNAIKDIIDRFNKLKGKYGDFVQKAGHPDGPARVALKKGIKDGDNFKTIDYLTSVDLTETKGILPTIFVICSYFKHVKEWNDKYKLYKSLPEASAYDSEIDEALKRIDVAIPQDIKADVYDKSKGDWEAAEYKAVIDQITKLIGFVQKNPKIINNEFLESIKEIEEFKSFSESAEAFVNGLQSDTVDPVYKLMALIGLNINDEDESNGKLPDDLIKEIQQYTSTIEKIGNGSSDEVTKYKQQGQDLGKKIMDAVKDNKELHDYIAEFLKRLGEATKETEGLYVISMVYAYNVFAAAEDLKPLLENFTKISNIFLMEASDWSSALVSFNPNNPDKALETLDGAFSRMFQQNKDFEKTFAAMADNVKNSAKRPKEKKAVEPLLKMFKDKYAKKYTANGDNANATDDSKIKELQQKLPDWLKKLIECANAGKKPVKISDYAKVYNPIKEEVGKYYAEIAEAKKIPEDKQAKDVLLKVIQLMSLIKEGEKKPEGENTPAPQGEQPKEGQAEQPQQQQANMKDNLNWLANEFYKYIRG